jgi:branched-chain amino acid transport system ATP-binding protein
MTAPMLEVEQVSLRLGRFPVLIDVDFSVGAGSCTGVVGPNGAGKTTLLDCITAHRRPGSGRILIDGAPVHRLRPAAVVALGVARTFQNVEQFKLLTVKQLALIGRHQRYRTSTVSAALALPRSRREEREHERLVMDILADLRIADFADEPMRSLPYSVRKVADLARALAARPRLILLDEPTAGMGPEEREHLHGLLGQLRRSYLETVVLVDHDVEFVRGLCERLVVMDAGLVIGAGETTATLAEPAVAAAYLGIHGEQADETAP